jgi:hypothetical protein
MKKCFGVTAVLIFATFFASGSVIAQGPAGVGAGAAAGNSSSSSSSGNAMHALNPTKWFGKKDAKSSAPVVSVDELDAKLEPKLRAEQLLAADASLKNVCQNFMERLDCLAALHASHDLSLNFECVKANFTGVRVGTDPTTCRVPENDKPLSLAKTIHFLKPDVNAKNAAKDAENAAKAEIAGASS